MTSSTKPPAGGAGKPAAPNSAAASGPTKRAGAASPPSTPQPAAMRQREDALALLAAVAHRHELRDIEARCRAAIEQAHGAVVNVAVLGKFKAGIEPELGLSVGTVDVNVWPWLLPGEEEKPITLRAQDCRAHGA